MTIAGVYLCPEGVVLAADSTMSTPTADGMHFFDHNQKIFEVGEGSTLGLVTWGLASFGATSIRSAVADLAESLRKKPPASFAELGARWADQIWPMYQALPLVATTFKTLHAKPAHDPANPASRTPAEQQTYENLKLNLVMGFCIGGRLNGKRDPGATIVLLQPTDAAKPAPQIMGPTSSSWWGAPVMVLRLLHGADPRIIPAIKASGKWTGSDPELQAIFDQFKFSLPVLPIRDAIDYMNSCVLSTIRGIKFSSFSQICGGPIELAVVTTDRKFRWVRHKPLDAAILDGDCYA